MNRTDRIAQARREHALYHSGCTIGYDPTAKQRPTKVCRDPCHKVKR